MFYFEKLLAQLLMQVKVLISNVICHQASYLVGLIVAHS